MALRRPLTLGSPPVVLLVGLLLALAATACPGGDDTDAKPPIATAEAGAITTTTPTATATLDSAAGDEDREVAVWGARVCEIARAFAADFLATGDPRDPQELPIAQRKQRAEAMFPVQFHAVGAALDALALVEPPERTADLHELLRETYEGLHDALRDQEVIVAAAASAEEIAFSNVEVNQWLNLAFRQAALLQNAGYC